MAQTRLKLGGYETWIVVENEKVEHYEVDVDEEEKLATCWIASTAGKHFGVWVVKRHAKFNCVADLYLDGHSIPGCFILKADKGPHLMNSVKVDSDVGQRLRRSFMFAAVNLTEEEPALRTQKYEAIGTIKIVIRRITKYKYRRNRAADVKPVQLQEDVKIPERAKKCATHQVSFGEGRAMRKEYTKGSATYERKEIVATFIFHYQSLDMLKAKEIAPCDPPVETKPVSQKRKVAFIEDEEKPVVEISDPEDEEDKRKEVQLEAELEKLRQARLDRQQSKYATKRVKCEPKPVFLPGEIIDLTI